MEVGNKCIICMSGRGDMNDIFGEFDQGYRIVDILKSTLNVEESSFESYEESPLMCETCIGIIVPFFYLKELYEKNREFVSNVKNVKQETPNKENSIEQLQEANLKPMLKPMKSYSRSNKRKESDISCVNINNVVKTSTVSASFTDKVVMPVDTKQIKVIKNSDLTKQAVKVLLTTVKDDKSTEEHINKEDIFIIVDEDGTTEINDKFNKQSTDPKYTAEEFRNYPCSFCPKEFFDLHRFKNHLKKVHSTDLTNPTVNVAKMEVKKDNVVELVCDVCGKDYKDEKEFKVHRETHKDYFCEICGMGFLKKSYLKDHKQVHDSNRFYQCDICNKSFQRRNVLTKHKRIHSNLREHVCGGCGRAFNEKGALVTHYKLVHFRTKDFKCPICECLFSLKSTLQKHILRHNKERERVWHCSICNLRYKDESSLNRHKKFKHSDYEVICGNCGKSFSTDSSLKRHGITCGKRPKKKAGKNKIKTALSRPASTKIKTLNVETENMEINLSKNDDVNEVSEIIEGSNRNAVLKKQNSNKSEKDLVKCENIVNSSQTIPHERKSCVDEKDNSGQSKNNFLITEKKLNRNKDLRGAECESKGNNNDIDKNERDFSQDTDE